MDNLFNGWEYISALFDCLKEMSDRLRKDRMVEPRYIFRGVTQRYFTSSPKIQRHLDDDNKEFRRLWKLVYGNSKQSDKDSLNPTDAQLRKIQHKFYEEQYQKLMDFMGQYRYANPSSATELLYKTIGLREEKEFDAKTIYGYVKPRYIRSGAAVRLYKQQNRTQTDYSSYLRYLISEMKSRHPLKYNKEYSDLELLAEIQHKGGATCLVDFSTNFLISLWFATQDYTNEQPQIGYIYCYDVNADSIERNNLTILNMDKESNSIEELISDTQKCYNYYGSKFSKFFLWKPSNINTRIARQDSIFVFGIEKFKVEDHTVFILPIPPKWKEPIQRVLKNFFGITGETLYDDPDGVSSANTKRDALKTQTLYFSEKNIGRACEERFKLTNFEMFQKGISSLLKAQYKLALDYLGIFEASNIAQFAELEGYEHNSDYNYLKMLSVELDYSKGICLRHMSMAEESLMYYSQAYYKNIDLLCSLNIKERPEFTGDYFDQAGEDPLNRYVFDKLFKILEDYINLLYDTKYFRQASEILNDLIFRLENSEFVIPDEMRDIVYTTYNEVALLDVIHCKECNEKDAIIKFKDLPMNHGLETYPFCNVLNKYFQLVYEIVCKQKDLKKNKSKIEKLENDLSNALKYAICSQPLPKCGECNKELFAGWILGDIKNIVKDAKMKSDVRDTIYYYTAMVEDCIRQIEGRKRQEIY